MLRYKIQDVERHEAFDQDAEQARLKAECDSGDSVYPRLCGSLGARLGMTTQLARELLDELLKVTRRKDALEWAAEHVLDNDNEDENYEMLYATADVIEEALKNGMTDDELRERLKGGIDFETSVEDGIVNGQFINRPTQDDRPNDIEHRYCSGGMNDVRFG